jgi:hypothetical protein
VSSARTVAAVLIPTVPTLTEGLARQLQGIPGNPAWSFVVAAVAFPGAGTAPVRYRGTCTIARS